MTIVRDADDNEKEIDTEKCAFCKGNSSVLKPGVKQEEGKLVYMTSQEWCAEALVCAATIDWDKVYNK